MNDDERPIAGRIEGVPLPSETATVLGHDEARETFLAAKRSGRLHHAWLLTGPRGIGKATLAFSLALEMLADGSSSARETVASTMARGAQASR